MSQELSPQERKAARVESLHRCVPSRTALIVVDMQRAFIEEGAALAVPQARAIVAVIRELIATCRERDIPVIYTKYVYSPAIPCLRGDPFGPEHLPPVPGNPICPGRPSGNALIGQEGCNSAEIVDELRPEPHDLSVEGFAYDKFYGTPLDHALRSRDIRYLAVTGVLADVCVNATIMSASTREYRVTAVKDGTATMSPDLLDACFRVWGRKFARLTTADDLIAEWRAGEKVDA